MFKVGIIPFYIDEKNKFMEVPLKTYDYIAAGLHVVMISSSVDIDTGAIHLVKTYTDFIETINKLMVTEIDVEASHNFLKFRSMAWFEKEINNHLLDLQ